MPKPLDPDQPPGESPSALAAGDLVAYSDSPDAHVALALDHLRAARLQLDKARELEGRSGRGRYLAAANTSAEGAELWCLRALGRA